MANNKLKINIDVDTTEALKQMKEVTEAANECVAALERLEKLTNKFSGLARGGIVSAGMMSVPVTLNGGTIAESVSKIQENESIRVRQF
ncbi:hypothetical protein P4U03_30140 [Bacillus mycoides]|uniref:Phage related protein n=11 Tax=root TaxID=1 RepID=I7ILX8_9CAUD|nr:MULTISPECIES: hypothetical protein [Bacillus cereus group]YP_006560747.1 phage related protein [Staphylococcus phage SpaA1]YP_009099270.1 hypothetical protein Waukesha92_05 [Bacillus phage Waukesha92]YP_009218194.1 hypothetical protein XO28_0061 [Bacillus phage phi4J1]YP_009829870.1 phage related protein [Bacillus phage BceA1]ALO79936.1 hypothetical protein XO29_0073 [Bacillus phage phiS58]QCW20821.1 hypothetical protein WG69_0076 [Bacillus phage vB_BthS-TP21T]AID50194.1 hypothetical prot